MLNFEGLRKRQSYNEIVHYIQAEQPKLKYPNRRASFLVNSPQYSSLLELDGMDEQEEEIKKAHVVQSLGPTLLAQHVEKASVGSGPGESVFNMGKHGPEPAPPAPPAPPTSSAAAAAEPAPPKKTIMSYFTSGKKAPPASSASASASASVPAAALPPPSAQDVQALTQKAANFAQASKPAVFQIFGQDDEDFHSGEEEEEEDEEMEEDDDDSLARELADSLAQHDREEAEREKAFADQVKDHLGGVSQQGTPLAHSRAQSVATQRSPSPTKPAAIPVAQVERSESQPVRRRIRGKSSEPKVTYKETPGASSSGVEPRGRSRSVSKIKS